MADTLQVLVVDDEVLIARSLSDMLTRMGYTVEVAYDGESALKIANEKQPQLMILDYQMPDKNGVEVLQELRQNPQTEKIEVIFATNTYDTTVINTVLSLNVHDYILKADISLEQIAERVKKYLPVQT